MRIPCPCAPLNVDREVRDILCPRRELRKLLQESGTLSRNRQHVETLIQENNDLDRKWEGGQWLVLREGVKTWVDQVKQLEEEIDSLDMPCTCCFLCSNYSLAKQIRDNHDAVTTLLQEYQNGAWGNEGGIWRKEDHAPSAKETEDKVKLLLHLRERMEISAEESKPGKKRSKIYRNWLASVASVEVEWNQQVRDNPDPNSVVQLRAEAMRLCTLGKQWEENGDHLLTDLRHLLEEKYMELVNLRSKLNDVVDDLLKAFPSKVISDRVNLWLKQVEAALVQVEGELKHNSKAEITTSADHGDVTIGNLRAEIARLLKHGEELMSTNSILVVTRPRETINNLPGSRADHPVGLNDNMSKVFEYLQDDNPRCIGIRGMGGVGKTALVMEIIERLKSPDPPVQFDCVISVVVSKDQNIKKIQEDIGVQLGFARDNDSKGECLPSNMDDRAKKLLEHLSRKTFLLILDDVWKKIDLAKVGVPSLRDRNPKSKILLTTREEDVCMGMECREPIMLVPLDDSDSWDLFCHYILDAQELFKSSEDIHSIAQAVKNKCGGLPLAIRIVACAMPGHKDVSEWELAKSQLDSCLPGDLLPDQEEQVYNILKYSFDNLPEERQRSCFLFCALYPEDENIAIPELVNYWIGEGLLDYSELDDFELLQRRGYIIVAGLKRACLLESGDREDFVKMHDLVRNTAIWLGKGGGGYKGDKFFTEILSGQQVMVHKKQWDVDRVVLCNPDHASVELVLAEEEMPPSNCILLRTFIFHGSKGSIKVPESFFPLAANLRVLVLALSSFPLPMSLFELKSLRHLDLARSSLSFIPVAISCLISLQFLNLSWNDIVEIPMEFGKLTNLVVLELKYNYSMTSILSSSISPLRKLQILDLKGTPCFKRKEKGALRIEDLRNFRGLRNVSLDLYNRMEDVNQLVHSNAVPANSVSYLSIWQVNELTTDQLHSTASKHSRKLKQLQMIKCPGVGGRFRMDDCFQSLAYLYLQELSLVTVEALTSCRSLEVVHINFFPELENFPSLLNFPNLKSLVIRRCEKLVGLGPMEEQEEAPSHSSDQSENPSLPKLQDITLLLLTQMRSISNRHIYLPSLSHLHVYLCPRLKKLAIIPPDTNVQIQCPRELWESLEWDRKERFKPQFS